MADRYQDDGADASVLELDEFASASRPPPKKRRRIVISCTECHRRKQKCDRELPCTNCKSRKKESACRYETGAPTAKEQRKESIESSGSSKQLTTPTPSNPGSGAGETLANAAADWGYSRTGASTLGFLRKIEGATGDNEVLAGLAAAASQSDEQFGLRDKYKSLIRQLPAKVYIDKLVEIYFREFNWQYYPLDHDLFLDQLAEWNKLPFNVFSTVGPQGLSPELRAFPALLFEVLALALLILSESEEEVFEPLKYAGSMTFEDLAVDYSESGMAVLSLLGKRQITLTTVQGGFIRAAVLKYLGKVTESWHAIGSAIRDAQEIGMHRDSLDPQPASSDVESVLENMWLIERRRRIYMTLMVWDIHTAIVLGRPGSIDWRILPPTLPVDAPIPTDRRRTPVVPRDEDRDPPTPLTRAIWAFKIMSPMRDILDLEQEGPCPKDFTKVDRVHQMCLDLQESMPAFFRLENPDRRWDDYPGCPWLKTVRYSLPQLTLFNFMALHRPYIFNRQKSRQEALRASLEMLHLQRLTFQGTTVNSYKNFQLFFGSFDAVVLMASIYILFPKENQELAGSAMQHFRWTSQRFEAMQERNHLAKSAKAVLQAIYVKFRKAVGNPPPAATPGTESVHSYHDRDSISLSSAMDTPASKGTSGTTPMSVPESAPEVSSYPPPSATSEWTVPVDVDFGSIAPLYPMTDLIYHELNGIPEDGGMLPPWPGETPSPSDTNLAPWQFEGDFGSDSFWNVLNQYNPVSYP